MQDSIEALNLLVKDLGLKKQDGTIRFTARVNLFIGGYLQSLNSEIHVITSDGLASLYVLDLEGKEISMPEMFDAKKDRFTYIPLEGLKINGDTEIGPFTVSIVPKAE